MGPESILDPFLLTKLYLPHSGGSGGISGTLDMRVNTPYHDGVVITTEARNMYYYGRTCSPTHDGMDLGMSIHIHLSPFPEVPGIPPGEVL